MTNRSKYLTKEIWSNLVEERDRPRQNRLMRFGSPRKEADVPYKYKPPFYEAVCI